MAGGGWILINPAGIIEDRFAWGLGMKTNNQVETYGLFLRLSLAQKKEIMDIYPRVLPVDYKSYEL